VPNLISHNTLLKACMRARRAHHVEAIMESLSRHHLRVEPPPHPQPSRLIHHYGEPLRSSPAGRVPPPHLLPAYTGFEIDLYSSSPAQQYCELHLPQFDRGLATLGLENVTWDVRCKKPLM